MNVSGTLHLYSGDDRELFFVFDDDVAQELYKLPEFDIDDLDSRRVYISVGTDRFIHRRTLSFSRKQTEIKVSLCSRPTKNGLDALTALYDWFAPPRRTRPEPFGILGILEQRAHANEQVWELHLTEPAGLVDPPGLGRRKKRDSGPRRSFNHRRKIIRQDLAEIGRPAEELALSIAQGDFPMPKYSCIWRDEWLDSNRIEIRKLGIIADIDVWDNDSTSSGLFIEVKAQKVRKRGSDPAFFLSLGEWRSYAKARAAGLRYEIWLFQYQTHSDFTGCPEKIRLVVFDRLLADWLDPDGYFVTPPAGVGAVVKIDV